MNHDASENSLSMKTSQVNYLNSSQSLNTEEERLFEQALEDERRKRQKGRPSVAQINLSSFEVIGQSEEHQPVMTQPQPQTLQNKPLQ